MDEPTDGLDPNQKHEVRTLIKEMAPNKAIIISTHILEEVESVCSRAVIHRPGPLDLQRHTDGAGGDARSITTRPPSWSMQVTPPRCAMRWVMCRAYAR